MQSRYGSVSRVCCRPSAALAAVVAGAPERSARHACSFATGTQGLRQSLWRRASTATSTTKKKSSGCTIVLSGCCCAARPARLGNSGAQKFSGSRSRPCQLPFSAPIHTASAPRFCPSDPTPVASPVARSPPPKNFVASSSSLHACPKVRLSSPLNLSETRPLGQLHCRNSYPATRSFSTSAATMTATRIDGTAIAKKIREGLHAQIQEAQKANPKFQPCLKIIQGE